MTQNSVQGIEFLIQGLFILEKESGICVFEQNYVDITKDGMPTDLISSFLSAILSFAGETFTDEIQHIQFSNRKIIFEFSEHVLFVVIVSDAAPATDAQIKRIIRRIAEKFNAKYTPHFETSSYMNVEIFNGFSEDLYEIVKREPLSLKIMQFLDFSDHFKKIEKFFTQKAAQVIKIDEFFRKKKKERDADKRVKKLLKEARKLDKRTENSE